MPEYQLDSYANTVLAQSLSTLPGVGQVAIGGEQLPAVTVQVDPQALAARGISLAQIDTALTNATLEAAKGNLEGSKQQFTLDTNDQLLNAEQFRNIIVTYQNGAPVMLKDVGDVINSSVNPRSGAWFDGKPAELLLIFRAAGANTVQVVDQVKSQLPQLQKSIPRSVHVDLLSDRSQDIRASVSGVETTLVITAILVVLVIFAFLRKPWATAIPSVTVPLAIIATFGAMYMLGYSIDNLSLMGLTIAIGFVVDDAIVMIENIVRYIEAGESGIRGRPQGCRPDRLHYCLDYLLADRGVHSAALHVRHRRAAFPRIRDDRKHSRRRVGLHCADADTHDVLAVPRSRKRAVARAYQPHLRRFFQLDVGLVRSRPELVLPSPVQHVARHNGTHRADRLSLHGDTEGLSSRSRTPASSSANSRRRQDKSFAAMAKLENQVSDHCCQGSRGSRIGRLCWRHRRQCKRKHRTHVHPAQTLR